MAKRCACSVIIDTMSEVRMITLPPDVRALWFDLARLMQRDGVSVLRFGKTVLDSRGLSRLVNRAETETETEFETKITELCERGLLAREGDGAISCPVLQRALSRSEINRNNGLRGGRPRKDGLPPGQTSLLLPIKGGVAVETEKTKTETECVETGTTTTTTNTNSSSSSKFVDETEFEETGKAVLEIIGIDPARSWLNYGLVRQWLADGATKQLVLGVVREVMGRPIPPKISSLAYFNRAISEAIAKKPVVELPHEKAYREANREWELFGFTTPRPILADFVKKFAT